jgi:hypothetical protein
MTDEEIKENVCGQCGMHLTQHGQGEACVVYYMSVINTQQPFPVSLKGRTFRRWRQEGCEFDRCVEAIKKFGNIPVARRVVKNKILCECGAHKIGILDKQPGHSSWCPAKLA